MNTEIISHFSGLPVEAVLKVPHGRYELSLTTVGDHPEILIYDNKTNQSVSEMFPGTLRGLKQAIAKIEALVQELTLIAMWPDEDWTYAWDVEEYMRDLGKSDDYELQSITDEELYVLEYPPKTTTGES